MGSALEENVGAVKEYLDRELSLGHIIRPVNQRMVPTGTQVGLFGVIPKSSQPGKWRLIVNLSSPEEESVSDGLESELCSLHYPHLDEVVHQIVRRGTILAKMNIQIAYSMVPVHPGDRPGYHLQYAPKIFSSVADAL